MEAFDRILLRLNRWLVIVILALMLGRIAGQTLQLQKSLNRLGRIAKEKFSNATPGSVNRVSEGFITCTLLFCVGPMAILGSVQDGLLGNYRTLALKSLMDGLATEASHYIDGSNHCWCFMTQQVIGPDGSKVVPDRCVPGRQCYKSALE